MHIFHKWSKWIYSHDRTYIHPNQTYKVLVRECLVCGLIQYKEIYF